MNKVFEHIHCPCQYDIIIFHLQDIDYSWTISIYDNVEELLTVDMFM